MTPSIIIVRRGAEVLGIDDYIVVEVGVFFKR